jgi:cold-inducible RNA-binding protein
MSVRLFVGNLSYDVTESDLIDFFSPVGTPATVILPMDRDTGKPRGFAFVEFQDKSQAEAASQRFNNQPLKGRNVVINEARARESRPGGMTGARPHREAPYSGGPKGNSARNTDFGSDPVDISESARAERRSRNFGPDARTAKKKKLRQGSHGESGGRRKPIRERSGGQFFGSAEDDEDYEDDAEYKRRW